MKESFCKELLPTFYKKYIEQFVDFGAGIIISLGVSHNEYQSTLRNKLGRKLANTIGINPIPPKAPVISKVLAKKFNLSAKVAST